MRCDEYREATSAWYDGEKAGIQFADLLEHVHACPECRHYMAHLPGQAALLRRHPVPVEVPQIGPGMRGPKGLFGDRFNAPLAVAAAIILVILTIAIQGNLQSRSSYAPEFQENGVRPSPRMEER